MSYHELTDAALQHSIEALRATVLLLEDEQTKLLEEQRRRKEHA